MRVHPIRIYPLASVALMLAAAGLVVPNPTVASELAWIRSGPEGGEVSALAVHPTDASVVFAGTIDGIFRSDDGGSTWSRKCEGIGSRTVRAIVINPQRTDEMFALVWGRGGLFKSADGGETWLQLEFGEERDIRILRYSPAPFVLYVVDDYDLFISADSGETWVEESIDTGFDQIQDLAVHPIHQQYMAVTTSTNSGGLMMSEDGGRSWRNCGRPPSGVYNVTFDPVDPDIVYVPEQNLLYRSNDGCHTWVAFEQPAISPFGFLVADPSRPRTLYYGNSNGVTVSRNGGDDWGRFGPADDPLSCADIALSPSNPDIVYLAAQAMDERRGVFQSVDRGLTWKIGMTALSATRIGSIDSNPADPTTVYAGANRYGTYSGNGVFKSWDSGNTWTFLDGTEGAGPIVAVDPISPGTVYATTADWGILKSEDGGDTWFEVWRGWGGKRISGIEVDHYQAGTLFLVKEEFDHALYRSDDGGETWVLLSLPDVAGVYRIDSDPRIPGVVYASTELGLYRSSDWGESWRQSATGLKTPEDCRPWGCGEYWIVTEVVFDPSDTDVLYASTENGPYRSTDGGSTWELISNGMLFCCGEECDALTKTSGSFSCEGGPRGMAVDPDRPSTVYMSTSLGTYRSYNRGGRWELITTPEFANPTSIAALGNSLLIGASNSAGVLRLSVSPIPSPKRPGHRILPGVSSATKANAAQHHQ